MWIEVFNTQCRILRATEDEKRWLYDDLLFRDERARFRGESPESMFNRFAETFPAGFLPGVVRRAKNDGLEVEVMDRRQPPATPPGEGWAPDLSWLRDYQLDAVQRCLAKCRGIIKSPTASGKTEMAIALTQAAPCRWVFMVHRSTLMDQTADRYEARTGLVAGRIGDQRWSVGECFTVATFQTLYSALTKEARRKPKGAPRPVGPAHDLLEQTQGIIVDEAHTLPADTFWAVAMSFGEAYYRIGMSGTPFDRSDRRSILAIGALGPLIYELPAQVLVERGVLARPKIRMVEVEQPASGCPTYQGVYGECIVRSTRRNKVLVELAKLAAKPCLLFVKEIRHGRVIRDALAATGLKVDFVWGDASTFNRSGAVALLKQSFLDVLVCSVIFQEGVDIPELRSIVVGSGGKSVIAALQRIGRGMRVSAGKTEFEVWDIKDAGHVWLERHSRSRIRAYVREGHEVVDVDLPAAHNPPSKQRKVG